MARYIAPYLLEELWREERSPYNERIVLLRHGVVVLDHARTGEEILVTYQDLIQLVRQLKIKCRKGKPTWEGFVQLALHISLALPALDLSDPAYYSTDVATAAAEYRQAKARLYVAMKNAYRDGCPLPDIARAANVEPVEIAPIIAEA